MGGCSTKASVSGSVEMLSLLAGTKAQPVQDSGAPGELACTQYTELPSAAVFALKARESSVASAARSAAMKAPPPR